MGLCDNILPEDKLPQCWTNDVRMNALFAPFRLKSANPESWDMKMKFWSEVLQLWCRAKQDPIFSASDAKFAFQRKGRTPACIEIVVEEMLRSGEISPVAKYHQILHNGPEGWVRWGARLACKPATLAISAVSMLLPARQVLDSDGLPKASIDITHRFVLESALKEQATQLLHNYPAGVERIGSIEELMRNCNWQHGRDTFEILLGYLITQGYAVKKDEVVKLADSDNKASAITETDIALVKLISTEYRLENDIARLSRDVAAAESEARAALQLGNRTAAKSHLRRKHKLQQKLQYSEAALENVQHLLTKIREVDINAAVVDTYRIGSEAMKTGMKDKGLDEDMVYNTMDDLREVMDNYNEVEKALGGNLIDDLDAAELEQELKDLLAGPGGPGNASINEVSPKTDTKLPSPPQSKVHRKISEREFVFDGEERIIAELNELSVQDASPKEKGARRQKVADTESWGQKDSSRPSTPRQSKPWYPTSEESLHPDSKIVWSNNNPDASLQQLTRGFVEVRQDDRLHPGQTLNLDYSSPPKLYNTDFQVQDHKLCEGVWLFNAKDGNSNIDSDLTTSTEYISSESPGKSVGNFQMAPGGERKKTQPWPKDDAEIEDLERRLRNLRGFVQNEL